MRRNKWSVIAFILSAITMAISLFWSIYYVYYIIIDAYPPGMESKEFGMSYPLWFAFLVLNSLPFLCQLIGLIFKKAGWHIAAGSFYGLYSFFIFQFTIASFGNPLMILTLIFSLMQCISSYKAAEQLE